MRRMPLRARTSTDEKFANMGVGMDRANPDPGRFDVTKKRSDMGKFKVPTLRDLAARAPYMHDGSVKTLGEVLDIYAKGGLPNPHLDTRLAPFYLDEETKRDLLAFLDSLNGEGWQENHAARHVPAITGSADRAERLEPKKASQKAKRKSRK